MSSGVLIAIVICIMIVLVTFIVIFLPTFFAGDTITAIGEAGW